MYVGFVIGKYKKIPDHFDRWGDSFLRGFNSPQQRRLYGFLREDVKLATYGRYLRGRHDVIE